MTSMPDVDPVIVVIGSVNIDHVVFADTFPAPGQTVRGNAVRSSVGGKGANQAAAAALAGGPVAMVARVGSDAEGTAARATLAARGVNVGAVTVVDTAPTGTAWITVAEQDNTIVVVPGANGRWPDHGDPLDGAGRTADVVLAQLEIPLDVVIRAAQNCHRRFVLNAAPPADLPDELIARCDVLIVNEHELAVVSRLPATTGDRARIESAHHALRERGARTVVTTLGAAGAMITDAGGAATFIPAVPATPVDTTGAGDAFTGVLAARLSAGDALVDAAHWASAAGSLAVRGPGAQDSYPDPETLQQAVRETTRT